MYYPNNNGNGTYSGHVRVYENNNGSWTQIGQDINGEPSYDYSGQSVSMSSDGNIVAIGAYQNDGFSNNSGHVRIYENNNGSWTQLGQDIDGEAYNDLRRIFSISFFKWGDCAIGLHIITEMDLILSHVRVYRIDVLKNGSGCDSTAILDLTIINSDTSIKFY